jgi:hypothetical protein
VAPEVCTQFVPVQVPSVDPLAVPRTQAFVLRHQPQLVDEVQLAQEVTAPHGSVTSQLPRKRTQLVPVQVPSIEPELLP